MSYRISVRYDGSLRDFLSVEEDDDGSLYVIFVRTGPVRGAMTLNSESDCWMLAADDERKHRISYHTSGHVRYHDFGGRGSLFFEPLVAVSGRNAFGIVSVPCLSRLDVNDVSPAFAELDLAALARGRVTFAMLVTSLEDPLDGVPALVRLGFRTSALVISFCQLPVQLAPEVSEHFILSRPLAGIFENQKIGRLEAELAFHQFDRGREIIVYPPNAEGVYNLYPSVVMRCVPQLKVTFTDSRYSAEQLGRSRPNRVKFRVRGPGGYVKSNDLRPLISSIELHAEL